MATEKYDSNEIRRAINILQEENGVFEIRGIGNKKDIISGYFRDADTLLSKLGGIDLNRNIYITLGQVKPECLARSQSEHFERTNQTTSDTEITAYRWLFIDLDPVRTAGISSSNKELQYAEKLSGKVAEFMRERGFSEPVRALSGNGYHLLYRVDIPNDEVGRQLMEQCLKVLSMLFDNGRVKIDTTNYNPSRICKLYGTMAKKGTSTTERPHRMSRILFVPEKIVPTDPEALRSLASELPKETRPARQSYSAQLAQQFDLETFLAQNGLTYKLDSNDRAKIYLLDECPFDANHRDGDSKIFQYHDGAIAFKCHHNSCANKRWQDVREKFEPGVYDREPDENPEIDAGWQIHLQKRQEGDAGDEQHDAKKPKIRKLKTAAGLMAKDLPEPRVIVGVGDPLPLLVEGTCILSAKPKLGKSWLALSMCLAVAKGEDFLGYKTQKCAALYLDLETSEQLQQKRLKKALKGAPVPDNFFLDTETNSMDNGFVDQIEAYLAECPEIGLVVVDVFQIIRSAPKSFKESEYDKAYRDITPLNELAQRHHISIILVCHDRKTVDPDDPFSNILGSTGLQGAATQMMVMFKPHKDDPIHISIKGKTIDGLPELNVKLEEAQWSIVEGGSRAEREASANASEYFNSDIRAAVVAIVNAEQEWRGRCSALIDNATEYNIGITEEPKYIGGFFKKHQGRFLKEDGIKITIIDNGTGAKIYKAEKLPLMTVDTVDDELIPTVDEWRDVSEIKGFEDIFP